MTEHSAAARPLFGCEARKDGSVIATIRAFASAGGCRVEASVFPEGSPAQAGPYLFATVEEARSFIAEAGESLTYLGCDVGDPHHHG